MTTAAETAAASTLSAYRDDGPVARLIGRVGALVPMPPVLLTLIAAIPIAIVLGFTPRDSDVLLGVTTGWFVLIGGIASGRPQSGRLGWLVPPMLRAVEFGYLLRLTLTSDARSLPICFAFLATLAFHHYDIVYRLRHQRIVPSSWVSAIGGGWDGRLVAAYVVVLAGVIREGMLTAAIVLAVVYLSESTVGWLRFSHAQRPALYEDEDEEE